MARVYNFSAGPAVLPEEVLKEAAEEMLDYKGCGMSVMEMSHRSKMFSDIIETAEADLRELMNIPDNYKVLFLQGGASSQFSAIPMNLMKNKEADFIITGQWAKKAYKEASRYGKANIIASSEASSNLQRFDGIRYGFRAEDAKNLDDIYVNTRSQGFGDEVKRRIMLGTFSLSSGYYDAYYKKAGQVRTLIIQDFEKVFADYDLILGPTAPSVAFDLDSLSHDPVAMYLADLLTIPVNLAGLPGISIPAGFAQGLPVGLQLIGPKYSEETIYQAAAAFEATTDYHKQQPLIFGGDN